MQRVVLEKFYFIPFTGIGFISTFIQNPQLITNRPPFQFCFPLMIESWRAETSEGKDFLLEPQAKFEVSIGHRKWIETYYYANFVFNRENEAIYDKWRKRFFPETALYFLENYDEVEASVYFITVLELSKESGEEDYSLVHNFKENFYVLPKHENENLFVLSKTDGEEGILEYIDEAVRVEIVKLIKKRNPTIDDSWLKSHKPEKVLYLNERFQKVFDEKLNKIKEELGLNEEV